MYTERRLGSHAEVWSTDGGVGRTRVLPDGCLDLILVGDDLVVAGPDSVARQVPASSPAVGVRLHHGRGPSLLGVPADRLLHTTVLLAALWGDARARRLREQVLADPWRALSTWAADASDDRFGARLSSLLASGASVAQAADRFGYSPRQLQRLCRPVFGYGPQHLGRVLRLQRTLRLLDADLPLAEVATRSGHADQAHLSRDVRELTGLTPRRLRAERVRSVQDPGLTDA